jgi:hypothetical protein
MILGLVFEGYNAVRVPTQEPLGRLARVSVQEMRYFRLPQHCSRLINRTEGHLRRSAKFIPLGTKTLEL